MTIKSDVYRQAAGLITSSEDPRAELLKIAQLQSAYERRRTIIMWSAAAAATLVVGIGLFLAFGGAPEDDPSSWDSHEKIAWVLTLQRRPSREGLSDLEEQRLRQYLDDHSSRVRRGAVITLSLRGREIEPRVIERVHGELTETIDLPIEFASTDGSEVGTALRMNRGSTERAIAMALWGHCARNHTYPHIATIESLAMHPDEEVRFAAFHALGELRDYIPTAATIRQLEGETERVRRAAKKLLLRKLTSGDD